MSELGVLLDNNEAVVCIIGAGYVGLPLGVEFARSGLKVIGFDLNQKKVESLNSGVDTSGSLENSYLKETLEKSNLVFTSDPSRIKEGDFIIICVPTPVGKDKEPDLSFVEESGETIGKNLKKGSVVVLESTVYPGVTEGILRERLEASGMVCGRDFSIGYSPERVNPGDSEHDLMNVVKIVSGFDKETSDILEKLYKRVIKAGVYKTKDIRTAEAAKVIENIQRDLNIALVNELSIIFGKMGIDIRDVLDAAGTKWNFHKYSPGMVGGHCIPVDPYYLVHKAKEIGYEPKIILAGREINDSIPERVGRTALESLKKAGKKSDAKVLLLGLTFKKNVKDVRNAPVKGIIKVLNEAGVKIYAYEPLLSREEAEEFGTEHVEDLESLSGIDCIITVTDHDALTGVLDKLKGASSEGAVILDVRGIFNRDKAKNLGFEYRIL